MTTSSFAFDRINAVLGQHHMSERLARLSGLDPERTRHLASATAAALIVGLADRLDGSGLNGVDEGGLSRELMEIGRTEARRVSFPGAQTGLDSVDRATIDALVESIAPVVASVIVDVRNELRLTDAALTHRLLAERRSLIGHGPWPVATSSRTARHRGLKRTPGTRNVVRDRVSRPVQTGVGQQRATSGLPRVPSWVWWSISVMALLVAIAVLVAPDPAATQLQP